MATPAQTPMTLAASAAAHAPAEPVPVAFVGRTSTLALQDPRASLNRQLRAARNWLPAGWFLAAVYWDIESGGIDLEHRSQGEDWRQFADADLPRDGGMADLLREAASPRPEVRRRRMRGHRALRPGHVQRPETGKGTLPAGNPAIRHRRARRHRRRQRHHRIRPPGKARRRGMVPAAVEREDLERAGRALHGRVEHRHPGLRVRRRPDPAPGAVQGRPGPHQIPAHPRPGPRPGHRPHVHLADRGQARLPGHRRPAQRRPRRLPAAEPGHRVDRPERPGHARKPQVHGAHGLRPAPHPQRPPHPRPDGPVAVVTGPGAPRDRGPGHLGRRPGHRRRARHQPRRRRPQQPPGHPPVLPLPVPRPVPGLPPPHGRLHLRQPRCPVHLLPVPARPRHPQARRRPPDHPRTVQAPELLLDQIVGQFFATASSDPAARNCWPPSSPPPTPTPPPTGTPRPPGSRPGSSGSRPRRTPRSSN